MPLDHPGHGQAAIRDNGPLNEKKLAGCLEDRLEPADWYRILNARVFFWLSRECLQKLLEARFHRDRAHDVLEWKRLPLRRPIGTALPCRPSTAGRPRGSPRRTASAPSCPSSPTLMPTGGGGGAGERVVELAVLGGVPDIARFTRRVLRMRGGEEQGVVWDGAGGVGFPPRPG